MFASRNLHSEESGNVEEGARGKRDVDGHRGHKMAQTLEWDSSDEAYCPSLEVDACIHVGLPAHELPDSPGIGTAICKKAPCYTVKTPPYCLGCTRCSSIQSRYQYLILQLNGQLRERRMVMTMECPKRQGLLLRRLRSIAVMLWDESATAVPTIGHPTRTHSFLADLDD